MESVYDRFQAYDFDTNASFQEGLRNIPGNRNTETVLKLKVFFYNRFVEPMSLEGYRQWIRTYNPQPVSNEGQSECMEPHLLGSTNHLDTEQAGTERALRDPKDCHNETCDNLSFAEVFRLIEAGEEVPGIQKLDIRPCQQTPTVSQMSRRLKPWERDENTASESSND